MPCSAHKWLYAPKGSAFLYVRRDRQEAHFPEPTVISSSGKQDFLGRFAYTGGLERASEMEGGRAGGRKGHGGMLLRLLFACG